MTQDRKRLFIIYYCFFQMRPQTQMKLWSANEADLFSFHVIYFKAWSRPFPRTQTGAYPNKILSKHSSVRHKMYCIFYSVLHCLAYCSYTRPHKKNHKKCLSTIIDHNVFQITLSHILWMFHQGAPPNQCMALYNPRTFFFLSNVK